MSNDNKWKIGAYIKLTALYGGIDRMSPIVSETLTQWRLKNHVRITKKRKSVVGQPQRYASIMTQEDVDLYRACEQYTSDLRGLKEMFSRMDLSTSTMTRCLSLAEVRQRLAALALITTRAKEHIEGAP